MKDTSRILAESEKVSSHKMLELGSVCCAELSVSGDTYLSGTSLHLAVEINSFAYYIHLVILFLELECCLQNSTEVLSGEF